MSGFSRWLDRVVTPDAVYGTILFAALIATSTPDAEGDGIPGDQPAVGGSELLDVLLVSVTTLLVFWLAHVYARTIARHGRRGDRDVPFGAAVRDALAHSNGMLWSAIPATLVLVLGIARILPDASDWALLVNILMLGFLGYQALAERGRAIPVRLLGALITALLGLVIIIVKVAVH